MFQNMSSDDGIVIPKYIMTIETFVEVRGLGWELEYNDMYRLLI